MASTRTRRRKQPPPPPKIYVGSLADHNDDVLHGVWLDATTDVDELTLAIKAMLAESPIGGAEEWAILDTDAFHDLPIAAHADLALVVELASGIAAHGAGFAAWYRHFEPEPPDLAEQFRAAYLGEDGAECYVWNLYDAAIDDVRWRTRTSPIWRYVEIDTARMARDLIADGQVVEIKAPDYGPYWVFRGDGVPIRPDDDSDDWYRG